MRPFDVEKGIASSLDDGRPAQKFMAKAQTQITLTSGQIMAFMFCPNLASDAGQASLVVAVGASSGGVFQTNGFWSSATVGDQVGAFGTITRVSTNTPYPIATLGNNQYEFSCCGAGLKFTYEGSELYRGGTLRYLYDRESAYNISEVWTGDSVNGLITFINGSANTIRQSINKDNVVEINASVEDFGFRRATTIGAAYGVISSTSALLGGNTATTSFGVSPPIIGYYVNTSGNTISFHVDCVEHWSLAHPDIQTLQTPSYAHAPMATHVQAVMANIRQAHAGVPNTNHASVAKTTLSAMKSPMGHELLNIGIRAALA